MLIIQKAYYYCVARKMRENGLFELTLCAGHTASTMLSPDILPDHFWLSENYSWCMLAQFSGG